MTAKNLDDLLKLDPDARIEPLTDFALQSAANGGDAAVTAAVVELLESGAGNGRARLALGEALAELGDPRLASPSDDRYWVDFEIDGSKIQVARFPVTNAEFRAFVDNGGYDNQDLWSEEGWEWVNSVDERWTDLAARPSSKNFIIDNQPVVGVTFHEAQAYAKAHDARLLHTDERVVVFRGQGDAKRPYPWGKPFGEGNANTQEEVLGRPCAVGLYVRDTTPEGVCDLAGNVAEWTEDGIGAEQLVHPGAWNQPSMASWAKAWVQLRRDGRLSALGFRLAREL